jgi:hypothetical protein
LVSGTLLPELEPTLNKELWAMQSSLIYFASLAGDSTVPALSFYAKIILWV